MKKIIFTVFIAISIGANAQTSTLTQHKSVFRQSLKAGDITTAIQAANYIVVADAKSTYRDSLAILYYNTSKLDAAYFWASEVLKQKPKDMSMLEVKAASLKLGNQPIPAIEAYSQLFTLKKDAVYGYELMNLQYGVQRLLECASVAEQVLKVAKIDSNLVMNYTVDGKTKKQTPLKAAIFNLYGLALGDLKKFPEAEQAFSQALLIDKEYALAQKNLDDLKAKLSSDKGDKPKE